MTGQFVVDTCTLVNFAVVDRMDLIRGAVLGGRWVTAVEREVRRSAQNVSGLDYAACQVWLGDSIDVDDPGAIEVIENLRLALGGARREPLKHLGEAQSIHAILTRPDLAAAIFVTDDLSGADLARRNNITVWTTQDIVRRCYRIGLIGCPDAYDLLSEMRHGHRRGVQVPRDHSVICP